MLTFVLCPHNSNIRTVDEYRVILRNTKIILNRQLNQEGQKEIHDQMNISNNDAKESEPQLEPDIQQTHEQDMRKHRIVLCRMTTRSFMIFSENDTRRVGV